MKLWDWTVYMVLTVLLVNRFSETENVGYGILIAFMVFAYGRKFRGDLR